MRWLMKLGLVIVSILGMGMEECKCKVVQFIFGDSLADVGNNIRLSKSLAKANMPWYGIDFGDGTPNGRYTNGRTVADIVGDNMGFPRPVAFLDPGLMEDVILESGVNYAAGGGGILNNTGSYFIQRLCLYKQIELFKGSQELVKAKIGDEAAERFFKESVCVIALGSNDFINNYLMPVYTTSLFYNDQTFITYLMETLEAQLKVLHGLGVRNMFVFGLGPIGCIPLQRTMTKDGKCRERVNKLAFSFNQALAKLLNGLSTKLSDSKIVFGDAYDIVNDVIHHPQKHGFNNSDLPCCWFGASIRPAVTCTPLSKLCKDRSKYVFWDEYHPSDATNQIIANELVKKFGGIYSNLKSNAPSPSPAFAPFSHG